MNKFFKSFIALFVMAIATVFVVSNVFAEISSSDTGTITVNGIKEAQTQVDIYRIIDVNIDDATHQPAEPVYKWVASIGEWLNNHATYEKYVNKVTKGETTVYEVTKDFDKALSNSKEIAEFYGDLETAIKTLSDVPSVYSGKTAEANQVITVSDAPMGSYLVSIGNSENYTYRPSVVNLVPKYDEKLAKDWILEDVTVNAKPTKLTIDKKVEGGKVAQAFIGQVVKFSIDVDYPNFPHNELGANDMALKITDRFTKGITFNTSSLVVKGDGTTVIDPSNYEIVPFSENGITGFDITIKGSHYYSSDLYDSATRTPKYEKLTVEYTGTVNENAVVTNGDSNTATLDYHNKPADQPGTSEVKVYTYGVKIHKFKKVKENDADVYSPLKDAIFQITDVNGSVLGEEHAGEVLKFITTTIDGKTVYVLAPFTYTDNDPTKAVVWGNGADSNITVVSDDGIAEVKGLVEGTYKVEETKAPNGFVKLQQPYEITITDTRKEGELCGEVSDPTRLVPDAEAYTPVDGYADQDVINSEGFELPVTGGIGTFLFSVLGILFMGIAAFLIKSIFSGKKVENN